MYDPDLKEILNNVIQLRSITITGYMEVIEDVLTLACPDSAVEIQMLIDAGKERIVEELLSPTAAILPRDTRLRLQTERIGRALATNSDAAKWIVETWEYALNVRPSLNLQSQADRIYADRARAALAMVEQRRFGYKG